MSESGVMDMREAFEAKFPVPDGVYWCEQLGYYTTKDPELIPDMDRINELQEVWQAALSSIGDGSKAEPVGDCATCEGEFPDSCSECSYSDEETHPAPTAQDSKVPESEALALIIGAALYDFGGYLTTREDRIIASATDDASPMAEAVSDFCKARGIEANQELPILSWQKWLSAAPSIAEKAECDNCVELVNSITPEILDWTICGMATNGRTKEQWAMDIFKRFKKAAKAAKTDLQRPQPPEGE